MGKNRDGQGKASVDHFVDHIGSIVSQSVLIAIYLSHTWLQHTYLGEELIHAENDGQEIK